MKTHITLALLLITGICIYGQEPERGFGMKAKNLKPLKTPAANTTIRNCDPLPIPLYENFDAVTPPAMPLCWTAIVESWSQWAFIQTRFDLDPFSPPNHLVMSNGGDTSANLLLIIPEVDADLDGLQLKFHGRGSTNGQSLLIGNYILENNEFTPVDTIFLTETYTQYFVSLEAATGNRIAFKQGLDATWRVIYIDNVVLEEEPDCAQPEALDATEITSSSAMLQWTPRGEETLWNIEWGPAGFEPGTGTIIENVDTPSYLLTGLVENTAYHFYVQANCGQGSKEVSSWAGPYAFKTCYAIPFFDGFEENLAHDSPIVGWTQQGESGFYGWLANNLTIGNRAPRTGEWNALLSSSNTHWMFVDVDVTAGNTYNFIMYARQDGSIFATANIRVNYGLEGNIDAMTGVIIPQTSLTYGPYQELAGTFTPESSGRHYIGIRGSTNIDSWYIVVDDVYIIDPNMFGSISGTVTNAAGEAVEGALVTMADRSMVTDATGFYEFEELLPGDYVLRAEAGGYAVVYLDIQIEEGDDLTQDIVFHYASPDLPFNPVEAGTIAYPAGVWQFRGSATDGNYIYKTLENNFLYVFDPASLDNILEISSLAVPQARQVFFHDHLYVFSGTTVLVYDTSDPANLQLLSTFVAGGTPLGMRFDSQTAWLLVHDNGITSRLLELDISNPNEVTTLATLWVTGGNQGSLYYTPQRNLVYIHGLSEQNPATVSIVDVSEEGEPVIAYAEPLGSAGSRMMATKDHFFLAENVDSQGIIKAYCTEDPAQPELLISQNLPHLAQVKEISNVTGTLLLHTQHPDDGHRLISMVFDADENQFYEGVGLQRPEYGMVAKYDYVVEGFGPDRGKSDHYHNHRFDLPANELAYHYLIPQSSTIGTSYSPPETTIIRIEKPEKKEEEEEECPAELTVHGFKQESFHCVNFANEENNIDAGLAIFSAVEDDWILSGFRIQASGNGDDAIDIEEVIVVAAAELIHLQYPADDGEIQVTLTPPVYIAEGTSYTIFVLYNFNLDIETYATDTLKTFAWTIPGGGVNAEPVECEDGDIDGVARLEGITIHRLHNDEQMYFSTLEEAVEETSDGGTITLCPLPHRDNVTINKSLSIKGYPDYKDETMLMPKNPHLPVFILDKGASKSSFKHFIISQEGKED